MKYERIRYRSSKRTNAANLNGGVVTTFNLPGDQLCFDGDRCFVGVGSRFSARSSSERSFRGENCAKFYAKAIAYYKTRYKLMPRQCSPSRAHQALRSSGIDFVDGQEDRTTGVVNQYMRKGAEYCEHYLARILETEVQVVENCTFSLLL